MDKLNLSFLRQARRKKRLSLAQAGHLIGKSKSAVSRYESGQLNISTEILSKLLSVYDVSVTDVFVKSKKEQGGQTSENI